MRQSMLCEADLIAKRAALRWLSERHPRWTHQELADAVGMSRSWVSKWLQRLRQADQEDVMALHSRSRARQTPAASIASQPAVVQRILEIRTAPPENLQRVPGPEAILYYLHRDPTLTNAGLRLPRSQTPIWKILRGFGCIAQDRRRKPKPMQPRQPGEEVQFDLKDGSLVPADPEGKQQHVVEIANFVDAAPRSGCTARYAVISMRKPSSRWWPSFSASMVCPACSPLIMTRAWSAALPDAISPPRWCAFSGVLG